MMKIKWSPLAESQLDEILKFYTRRNGSSSYSKRLKKDFWKILKIIRSNRHFGEPLPGYDNRRRFSVGNFVLIYEFDGNAVRICSIRDGRRGDE
jgi:plasmid stabilization system protein ParE